MIYMARKKLTLVVSEKMNSNKKEDRGENGLIRMSKAARTHMGFENKVEIYPDTKNPESRISGSMLLDIYQAFSADLKEATKNEINQKELLCTGFVTSTTYNKITGRGKTKSKNVWITDDVSDTVIGADPEFLLFDGGEIVRANNVMGYAGVIGCDGAMAEVRPAPHTTPEGLVSNILDIFSNKKLTSKIKDFSWKAGCYYEDNARDYPVGGHIHIGNPAKIAAMPLDKRENFFIGFNKVVDELLAVPMIKIDGANLGSARRTKCKMGKYGYFGEYRLCDGRLEHRTLSGMWLMHPKLATAVLGTAKAIIDEVFRYTVDNKFSKNYMYSDVINREHVWAQGFNKWKEISITKDMGCITPSKTMIELLNNSSADKITLVFLKKWYSKMKGLSTYKNYASYIDNLYEILKIDADEFGNCSKVIQENWMGNRDFLS